MLYPTQASDDIMFTALITPLLSFMTLCAVLFRLGCIAFCFFPTVYYFKIGQKRTIDMSPYVTMVSIFQQRIGYVYHMIWYERNKAKETYEEKEARNLSFTKSEDGE
jgi:hypothetical protein